jgi:hypothetical protein
VCLVSTIISRFGIAKRLVSFFPVGFSCHLSHSQELSPEIDL